MRTKPCTWSVRAPPACRRCTRSTQAPQRNAWHGRHWFGKLWTSKTSRMRKEHVVLGDETKYLRFLSQFCESLIEWLQQLVNSNDAWCSLGLQLYINLLMILSINGVLSLKKQNMVNISVFPRAQEDTKPQNINIWEAGISESFFSLKKT